MYRGLIDYLAFAYQFVCKGRGVIPADNLKAAAAGAHTVAVNAQRVIGGDNPETDADHSQLVLAMRMDEHIAEIVRLPD